MGCSKREDGGGRSIGFRRCEWMGIGIWNE
jgi:hypothetical protein